MATIREELMKMDSYPYSDPNPIPDFSRIYPYYRFDGFTSKKITKEWHMVILENRYIEVYICPDIGGKVWGAIEKSTGKDFIYFNHAVKFRDVALRGPWTSGGIEFNFGTIGHVASCASPVEYSTRENSDGSVSCFVGGFDLVSRTQWIVEILLPEDSAFFITRTRWINATPYPTSHYQWMNAAAKTGDDLEFLYPGSHYIGHMGELGDWPIENGREIYKYPENAFGIYKSYHVLDRASQFFGGYYRKENFGFGHWCPFDEKLGKKIFLWGQSRWGMIWEDLLTDTDGQYIEWQAGKWFNQATDSSSATPFKHPEFHPHDTEYMQEYWFPIKDIRGAVEASPFLVLNIQSTEDKLLVQICPLQPFEDILKISMADKVILAEFRHFEPLVTQTIVVEKTIQADFCIHLEKGEIHYSSKTDVPLDRPLESTVIFGEKSAFKQYYSGLEYDRQRIFNLAEIKYQEALKIEPNFLPALGRLGLLVLRRGEWQSALKLAKKALSIDSYDPLANYIFGLAHFEVNSTANARSGFAIASASPLFRTVSFYYLAVIAFREKNYRLARDYCKKSIKYNSDHPNPIELMAIIARKEGKAEEQEEHLSKLQQISPFSYFIRSEKNFMHPSADRTQIKLHKPSEFPDEHYLELAIKYLKFDLLDESLEILKRSQDNPIKFYWMAYIHNLLGNKSAIADLIRSANRLNPRLIFPFRQETRPVLEFALSMSDHWVIKYYLALIYMGLNRKQNAYNLLKDCKNIPDYFAFYLLRTKLCDLNDPEYIDDLEHARNLEKNNWRIIEKIILHHLRSGDEEMALIESKNLSPHHPENARLTILHAKVLSQNKFFKISLDFLASRTVLPYEGAFEIRDIYYNACINESLKKWDSGDYNEVIYYAELSTEWPENLGIGKPYNIDNRLADYIKIFACKQLDMHEEAALAEKNIINYQVYPAFRETSDLLVQLSVLSSKDSDKASNILLQHCKGDPDNFSLRWVKAKWDKESEKALELKEKLMPAMDRTYDTIFRDPHLPLVEKTVEFFQFK